MEVAVQVVERWILARLRKHTFFSLAELNAEIHRLLEELNNRGFKKLPGTRRSVFESLERAALKSLPTTPYEFAEWKKLNDYRLKPVGCDGRERLFRLKSVTLADESA